MDVDYLLHENPELQARPVRRMTGFVGGCRNPTAASRAPLTADHDAEMIEQSARFPRVRDRSLFVGDSDDVVPEQFGRPPR